MVRHHKFTHTHIEHHKDGSHTIHHVHMEGPEHDVKGAAADHDSMMDHMMDHTSAPNPGEAEANAGDHGAPAAMASAAGMPAAPAMGA